MKMLVAPPPSLPTEASSAAMSHSPFMAAAEWRRGIDTRTRTPDIILASRSVQLPLETKGNRNPLKKAAGL